MALTPFADRHHPGKGGIAPCRAVAACSPAPRRTRLSAAIRPAPCPGRAGGDPPMFRRLPLQHLLRRITHRSAHLFFTDRTAMHGRATRDGWRTVRYAAVHLAITALMLSVPAAAFADPSGPVYLAANDLPTVISNLQKWVMGLL